MEAQLYNIKGLRVIVSCLIGAGVLAWTGCSPVADEGAEAARLAPVQTSGPAPPLEALRQQDPFLVEMLENCPAYREAPPGERTQALAQISALISRQDADAQDAVRLVMDRLPRPASRVEEVLVDGSGGEWWSALPPAAEGMPSGHGAAWPNGATAFVRGGALYVMGGCLPPTETGPHVVRCHIDYMARPGFDATVVLEGDGGDWHIEWKVRRAVRSDRPPRAETAKVVWDSAFEARIPLPPEVAAAQTDPIWDLRIDVPHLPRGARSSRIIPIANEDAAEGTAAEPSLSTLFMLAADRDWQGHDTLAASIAIAAAPFYAMGDDAVREELRNHSAEWFDFALETIAWQEANGTSWRLADYPLEAMLAWANRMDWSTRRQYFHQERRQGGVWIDAESYQWLHVDFGVYRDFRQWMTDGGCVQNTTLETLGRAEKWLNEHGVRGGAIERLEDTLNNPHATPNEVRRAVAQLASMEEFGDSRSRVAGQFGRRNVREVGSHCAAVYRDSIVEHGRWLGGCVTMTGLTRAAMRSLGIASLNARAEQAGHNKKGHHWTIVFQPEERVWRGHQAGRSRDRTWHLSVMPLPIYAPSMHAAGLKEVVGEHRLPYPEHIRMRMTGKEIKQLGKVEGIPTGFIRDWLLTPHFDGPVRSAL